MPTSDDDPRHWSGGRAELSRHRRRAGALPKIQVSRSGVWTDICHQSGEIDRSGAISKCGDDMMRVMLHEAAQIMLVRSTRWSWLKAWAMQVARRCGLKKAIVALARRLAVIMHRIWVDGTEFRWTRQETAAA